MEVIMGACSSNSSRLLKCFLSLSSALQFQGERLLSAEREWSNPTTTTVHFVQSEQSQPLLIFVIESRLGKDPPRCR